jgi:lysophospholipase L1-like esterase
MICLIHIRRQGRLCGRMGKMKLLRKLVLLVGIVLVQSALDYTSTVSAWTLSPIRIMPIGDSITDGVGSTGTVGYRRPLYKLLSSAGYKVDFVGSQTTGSPDDFDRNHEGHSGWRADQIRDSVTAWLNSTPPDIVLLHIGTNDISENQGATSTAAEISQILDNINSWETSHNQVWIILARIINRNDSRSGITTTLNSLIQDLAVTRIARGDKIAVVDMESAVRYPGDLADPLHPNDKGYGKMAAVWFAALESLFVLLSNPDHDGKCELDGKDLAAFIATTRTLDITTLATHFAANTCSQKRRR